MMLTDSDCVVGKPSLARITYEFPVNRQECCPDWLVSAIATLVTTKPLSASLQRVMAGMKYQI